MSLANFLSKSNVREEETDGKGVEREGREGCRGGMNEVWPPQNRFLDPPVMYCCTYIEANHTWAACIPNDTPIAYYNYRPTAQGAQPWIKS